MENKHLQLGYHLVSFLDVLGQREKFKALHLPKTPEEEKAVAEILRQTAGFVLDLRKAFEDHFITFESALGSLKKLTTESARPRFVGFSDSFVTSVQLHSSNGNLIPVVTIFSALSAAAVVMLVSLSSKHPLRGGIDVGLATEIGPGEIYGTALEKAHLLESAVAQYPRIVVGDELWDYLNATLLKSQQEVTPEANAIIKVIEKIKALIAVDHDGKRILDYLGSILVDSAKSGSIPIKHMIKPIYDFVLSEQTRINESNDEKLIVRYQAFRKYVESRLHLWELDIPTA